MRPAPRDAEFIDFTARHRTDLVRMATLLTAGDLASAEDLVQTTLTRLYLAWPRVRAADNRLAYARTSLTHVFVDETRRAHRRRESVTADPETGERPVRAEWDSGDRDLVRSALLDLPPRQRAVVVLRHWLDLDVAQTARMLGCSTGTVKSQNSRALDHLRVALTPFVPLSKEHS